MLSSTKTGIILMVISSAIFASGSIGVKVFGGNLSPWQISVARAMIGLVLTVVIARFSFRAFLIPDWFWYCLLGVTANMGLLCAIQGIKLLPLSVAVPLYYLYPALGALMSPLINHETPNRRDWLAIFLAFLAVTILSLDLKQRPEFSLAGLCWCLSSALSVGLLVNLTRRHAKNSPIHVIMFYLFLVNLLMSLPLCFLFDNPLIPQKLDLIYLFCYIALAYLLGLSLMSLGYRYVSVYRGSVIQNLEIVFCSLFGVIFLKETLTAQMGVGAFLALISAVMISTSKSK